MGDEQKTTVQDEAVPATTETPQTTGDIPKPPEAAKAPAQPLTEERIKQLFDEAVQKGVEKGKREMQSTKDAEIRRLQRESDRRIRLAESTAESIKTTLTGVDAETGGDIRQRARLAELETKEKFRTSDDLEEQQRQAQERYAQQLSDSLTVTLDKFGIERNDKRIDWGEGATDYLAGRSRFDASVAKILDDKRKEQEQSVEQKINARVAALEQKLRREAGLDTVDTSLPTGSSKGLTVEAVQKMTPAELVKHSKEIAKLPLTI